MMDTDAIYSAVCAYGAAKCGGYILDAHDHIESVKRLLNEAEEEHKSLLDTNEKLVDKVCGLEAARIAYASEFPPIPDGDDAGLPAVGSIHENIRRLKAENAELKAELERIKALNPVAWLHIPKVALDGKVRPVASTEKFDDDYGAIYSERIPLYALGNKT
jgi:hypothetical protein